MLLYQGLIGLGIVSVLHLLAGILKWWNYHQIQEFTKDGGLIEPDAELTKLGNTDPEFIPTPFKVILTQLIHGLFILSYPLYGFAVSDTEFFKYELSISEMLVAMSGFSIAYLICHKYIKMKI